MLPRKIPDYKETICQNNNTHSINTQYSINSILSSSKPGGSLVCLVCSTFTSQRMEKLPYNPECMQLLLPSQLGNIKVASLLPLENVPALSGPAQGAVQDLTHLQVSRNSSIRCLCNQSTGISFCCISRSAQRTDDACHLNLVSGAESLSSVVLSLLCLACSLQGQGKGF